MDWYLRGRVRNGCGVFYLTPSLLAFRISERPSRLLVEQWRERRRSSRALSEILLAADQVVTRLALPNPEHDPGRMACLFPRALKPLLGFERRWPFRGYRYFRVSPNATS